jgi:hypothetical protein
MWDSAVIPFVVVGVACVAGLSAIYWHHVRPPACRHCRTRLTELRANVISVSPPVVEALYRCPACGGTCAQRVVDSWD